MLCRTVSLVSIAFAVSVLPATGAMATAQRTFVASYGNDANVCSLTLPCRGFAAAVAQAISGGEVIVLDSAGYGPVMVTQSVSIIAPSGIYAGITVPVGGTGVDVAGFNVIVRLSGLAINSAAGAGFGVHMTGGSQLTVENCSISGTGNGISIETEAMVVIAGTVIQTTSTGVVANGGAIVNISNSYIVGKFNVGITTGFGSSGTTTNIFVVDTLVAGPGMVSSTDCIDNAALTGSTGNIYATRVTVTGCVSGFGNFPETGGTMAVSYGMAVGNTVGFANDGPGAFLSLGNNHVTGNTNDTSGSITVIGGK